MGGSGWASEIVQVIPGLKGFCPLIRLCALVTLIAATSDGELPVGPLKCLAKRRGPWVKLAFKSWLWP